MSHNNLLVLGVGPLPIDGDGKLFAPGLRTWHFAQMLRKCGHSVTTGIIEFGSTTAETDNVLLREVTSPDNGTIWRFRNAPEAIIRFLCQRHNAKPFDAIISTTDIMNSIAARAALPIPLWLDYNGDVFAEKQLMGMVHSNDATLKNQWQLFLDGLLAGDRFSSCSPNQTYALMGQLGFAGRLNQCTSDEVLVHTIVPCSHAMLEYTTKTTDDASQQPLRGTIVPQDAYIVLWMGGYNSWTSPTVLFEGLSLAMRRDERIYFVSTGGPLDGHITATFSEFYQLIQASDLRDRFQFTGWLPTKEVPGVARQADLAINLDAKSVEAELGYRNRIVDWILYGLPIASTTESHITSTLAQDNLIFAIETGNPHSLADAILQSMNNPQNSREMANRAAQWLEQNLDEEKVFAPLLDWARKPVRAKDKQNNFRSSVSTALRDADKQPTAPKVPLWRRLARRIKRDLSI